MRNPNYLCLSRHNIYYFRWPLPQSIQQTGKTKHFKISLRTRCPKEALQLSNCFAYHIENILKQCSVANMDHAEIILILKDYFYELLDEKRAEIRRDGPLEDDELKQLYELREFAKKAIKDGRNNILPDEDIKERVKPILERFGLALEAEDYETLCNRYKYALEGYCNKLITHNESELAFTFSTRPDLLELRKSQNREKKPENKLGSVLDVYFQDMKKSNAWGIKTTRERRSCLNLLVEILGDSYNLPDLDKVQARKVKDILREVPKNRNKMKRTREKPLLEQIRVPDVEKLDVNSTNKYLGIMGGFMTWAKNNGYAESNPFEGMKFKEDPNKKKRDAFSLEQVNIMLNAKEHLNNDLQYWGMMIALYTGARLNEISSLTPHDLVRDEKTGIWYFDITDEDEMKRLKTKSAKRKIPIHSKLLEMGILEYKEKVLKMNGDNLRLLYKLTYTDKEGWGRKLNRWFNTTFLENLGLKRKGLSFHSMRHTVITNLRSNGADNHNVRAIVGHEPDGVTEAVYVHDIGLVQLKKDIELLNYSAQS